MKLVCLIYDSYTVENVVSFTKKRFYRKRGGEIMRNYVETF